MKKIIKIGIPVVINLFVVFFGVGQTKIQGKATYNQVSPLADVDIMVDGTYDGAKTDKKGVYEILTEEEGTFLIIAKKAGYEDVAVTVSLQPKDKKTIKIDIVFVLKTSKLSELIVKAPTFASTDKNRSISLKPLEMLTTATDGNVASALKTLPGAQQVGESGDLFIRGGTGAETKTFVDGLQVSNFNYSSTANIAARSRFPPGLFKGAFFSSGGYSAEYGQALSATLILESEDIPLKSSAELTFSPFWVGANVNVADKEFKQSIGGSVNYTNLKPIFAVIKPSVDFAEKPKFTDLSLYWRRKFRSTGIAKFYGSYGQNSVAIRQDDQNYDYVKDIIDLRSKNIYTNLTYKETLAKGWKVFMGLSYSKNFDDLRVKAYKTIDNETVFDSTQNGNQNLGLGKVVFTKNLFDLSKLKIGSEYHIGQERSFLNDTKTQFDLKDKYFANFVELDSYLAEKVTLRAGLRAENNSVIKQWNWAPRASLGYTPDKNTLISFSSGVFYQKPDTRYLIWKNDLAYTKAIHHILSAQRSDAYRTFRTEAYYKKYENLIKTSPILNNDGYGYAKGVEVFWRDRKTLKSFDYWLSYSLLDTKRDFSYYPMSVQPDFAARHTFSAVLKRFFTEISTNISTTYTFATGRPYYNPNRPDNEFMADRTINYNNLGLSVAYLPKIKKTFSVLVLTVSNILGNEQVYGYSYSSKNPLIRKAITPVNNPFIFLGLIMNIGVDRTQDAINRQL